MYYYKARIYSPTLGRFLQTDPIGYEDNNNLYAYVANDPVNGTDPTGLTSMDCTGSRVCAEGRSGLASGLSGSSTVGFGGFRIEDKAENAPQTSPSVAAGSEESQPSSTSPQNPLSGSLNPLAVEYGELTTDYESGAITAEEFQANDRRQGAAIVETVTAIVVVGRVAQVAGALNSVTRSDIVRWGPTVVSNQILRGAGSKGASVRWTVKGGGGPLPWKYQIGSYNWYKPWAWFKQTPIIKP